MQYFVVRSLVIVRTGITFAATEFFNFLRNKTLVLALATGLLHRHFSVLRDSISIFFRRNFLFFKPFHVTRIRVGVQTKRTSIFRKRDQNSVGLLVLVVLVG